MNIIKNPLYTFLLIYSTLLLRDFFDINIPILIVTLLIFFIALISNEEALISLVVILIPIQEAVQLGTIYGFILLIFVVKNFNKIKIDLLLVFLTLIIIIELLHIIIPPFSFDTFIKFSVTYLLLGFLLQKTDKIINRKTIILSYTYSVLVSAILILLITIKIYDYDFLKIIESGFRIGNTVLIETTLDGYALSNNQNNLALQIVLVLSIIMTHNVFRNSSKIMNVLIGLSLLLIGFLTQSRAFFVTLILLVFMLIVFNINNLKRYIGIISITFLSFGSIIFFNFQIFTNLLSRFNESSSLIYSRLNIFNFYNQVFISSTQTFLLGIGMQSMHLKVGHFAVPHNSIQEVYIAWGIIGLLIIGCFIYFFIKKFYRGDSLNLIPFISLLFFSQFGRLFKNSNIVMLLFIIAIVLNTVESYGVYREKKNNIDF